MAGFSTPPSPGAASPDPLRSQDLSWLSRLSEHPAFTNDAESQASNASQMALRGTDALVLANGQLRLASLSALKHSSSSATIAAQTAKGYKVLTSLVLDRTLKDQTTRGSRSKSHRMALNPARTLLAVYSPTSLTLVVLPRSTSLATAAPSIAVKAHLVGSFYHNHRCPRSEHIVDVQWHPWSKHGTSLLVLLRDGTFHEYDVARDLAEPMQKLSLLPAPSRSRKGPLAGRGYREASAGVRSRYAADDSDEEEDEADEWTDRLGHDNSRGAERTATSFTLGIPSTSSHKPAPRSNQDASLLQVDWAPLTVYVLTQSADVFAVAPFLPSFTRLPKSYLHSLNSFVQLSAEAQVSSKQRDFSLRFVSNLLRQARDAQANKAAAQDGATASRRRNMRATTPLEVLSRVEGDAGMASSRRRGMAKSVSAMSLDPQQEADSDGGPGGEQDAEIDDFVDVESPRQPIVPATLAPQGPFLLSPAPHELSEEREARGSDIAYLLLPAGPVASTSSSAPVAKDLELLLITCDDGRIDVGVLTVAGKVAPRWSTSTAPAHIIARSSSRPPWMSARRGVAPPRSGRYGLFESSEDEEDGSHDLDESAGADDFSASASGSSPSNLPTLFIYETLDLGLPSASVGTQSRGRVGITQDPVYPDTIYVAHDHGAHMVSLKPWADPLGQLLGSGRVDEVQRFLHQGKESEARWIVKIQDDAAESPPVVNDGDDQRRRGVSSIEVVDDIYLGYSLLIQLSDGECLGLELNLRGGNQYGEALSLLEGLSVADQQKSAGTGEQDGKTSLYTSLLGDEPFVLPAPFNAGSASTSASFPNLRLKSADPSASKREVQVTPESLRLLGSTVQELRGRLRDVVQGGNTVQRRLELQMKELQRQVGKLKEIRQRIDDASGEGQRTAGGEADRIARISAKQRTLVQRVDRVLQRAMDASDTGLSRYEEAWLQELEGLEDEVGREGDEGLRGRVDRLQDQLEKMKPDLVALAAKQKQQQQQAGSSSLSTPGMQQLGTRQLERILQALRTESDRLVEAKEKVHALNRSISNSTGGAGGEGGARVAQMTAGR